MLAWGLHCECTCPQRTVHVHRQCVRTVNRHCSIAPLDVGKCKQLSRQACLAAHIQPSQSSKRHKGRSQLRCAACCPEDRISDSKTSHVDHVSSSESQNASGRLHLIQAGKVVLGSLALLVITAANSNRAGAHAKAVEYQSPNVATQVPGPSNAAAEAQQTITEGQEGIYSVLAVCSSCVSVPSHTIK